MRKIKQFFRNLYRVFIWIPVIWRDRNWDHCFLLKILEFKLKQMEDYFREHGVSKDHNKQARECHTAIALIHRMETEIYTFMFEERGRRCPPHLMTKQWKNEFDYTDYMYTQDIKYLGIILQKHLRGWWD